MDKTNPKDSIDPYATLRHASEDVGDIKFLISGFEILEEIGRGAFGAVYRARDTKLDRQVAIKISLLDDPAQRDQYIREAQNAARLDIPGIVPVYQVGTFGDGQPFVVQKLIDGSTMSKEIANGKITLHRACTLMAEIAGTVAQAHEMELIHRDLKPDNILIDGRGKPWVADFGLAILEKDQRAHRGEKAGTPLYMSPEQLQGRAEWLDGRTDIYSMGIILYELLTGRTPYDATTFVELEDQVLHRDPKPISQRSPHIPVELDTIFQNCCAKQVSDRYANAFELAEDLQAILDHTPEETLYLSGATAKGLPANISRRSKRPAHQSTRRDRAAETIRETAPKQSLIARAWWLAPLLLLSALIPFIPNLFKPSVPEESHKVPVEQQRLPLTVSKDGNANYATIKAALEKAEEGETITVQPGNYRENLTINRSITVKGNSEHGTVVIIGQNSPAFKVVQNAQVNLANLSVEVTALGEKQFNTIEVGAVSDDGVATEVGMLTMSNCAVDSKSFDGVIVHAGSSLNATTCNFRSEAHPGIRAKDSKRIEVFDCDFHIDPLTLKGKSIPTGIQADNCEGTVRKSRFYGKGNAVGIEWAVTDDLVWIDGDSIFQSCDIGIVLTDCTNAKVGGSLPIKMTGCNRGVLLQRSVGKLQNLQLDSSGGELGVRILDQPDADKTSIVEILGVDISNYQIGLSVENATASARKLVCSKNVKAVVSTLAKLTLRDCQFVKSTEQGLQAVDSIAILENCLFKDNNVGISVDGEKPLDCVGGIIEGNTVGLLAYSGGVQLRGSHLRSNQVGIAVQARQIPQYKMPKPVQITVERIGQQENKTFMLVKIPSSYTVIDCRLPPPDYDAKLRLETQGNTSQFMLIRP